MAITTAMANSYKLDILSGVQTSTDTYKIALYTSAATLSASTTSYSATNEVVGTNYTAGGQVLVNFTTGLVGTTAYVTFDNPSWADSTITANGCLIYNSSKSNKAVAVYDFGGDVVSINGTFSVTFPAAGATSLIRIA